MVRLVDGGTVNGGYCWTKGQLVEGLVDRGTIDGDRWIEGQLMLGQVDRVTVDGKTDGQRDSWWRDRWIG